MPKIEELELGFRQAAGKGDVLGLRRFANSPMNININSSGTGSKQTALHRAAAGGHKDALMLLINLGCDLEARDKDGKKAEELAKNEQVCKIFEQVGLAKKAIAATKQFFPKRSLESYDGIYQPPEHLEHKTKCSQAIEKSYSEIACDWEKHYREEVRQWNKPQPSEKDVERWNNQWDVCKRYVKRLLTMQFYLKVANQTNYKVCSCEEAVVVSLTSLAFVEKTNYLLESAGIFTTRDSNKNHAVLVMNRPNSDINDLTTWGDALIIDPYYERIFFMEYLRDYKIDTTFSIPETINVEILFSSTLPSLDPFPLTHEFYEQIVSYLREQIVDELAKRGIVQETTSSETASMRLS
ncbi:MAG: ankyrin repeat domain-containing protein [Gammaproteobacteria bacterium]